MKRLDWTKRGTGFLIAWAVLAFLATGAQAQSARVLALLPFDAYTQEDPSGLRDALDRALTAELGKARGIRLVDREAVRKAAAGRTIDPDAALEIGRVLQADYVVTGSVSEFGRTLNVDVRLADVPAGKTLPTLSLQGRDRGNLAPLAAQIRSDLVGRLVPEEKIARIAFQGNRRIDGAAMLQVLKSAPGKPFSDADLSADIKAIFRMGYFQDVRAEAADTPEGKVITFTVEEKAAIGNIVVRGNKALKRDDIDGVLTIKAKQIVNPEKIKGDAEKIKALYDSKGYYNAEIRDLVEKEGERDVRVVFDITEGERLYVRTISFDGNRAFTARELKKQMKTTEWNFLRFLTDAGLLKKEELRQDVSRLGAYYLNHGFIQAQVGEPEITHDKEWIYVKIPIAEGRQFRVGAVAIGGDLLETPRTALLEKLTIRKQDVFNREAVMQDIALLTQACNDEGYAHATVTPQTAPQEKTLTVDVVYEIRKGSQVYFHRISVTGNTKTRDKVIRRHLAIVEGDLYSSTNLKKSYTDLNKLRYFEEIDFQTLPGPEASSMDVNIHVREKSTGMFSIGAGYSGQDQLIFTAQVAQQNLFGRGQSLSLQANIGSVSNYFNLSFIEPWLFDLPLWTKADIWNTYREYDSYNHTSTGTGLVLGYPLWEHFTGYIGYRVSQEDVKDVKSTASIYIKDQEGKKLYSGATATLTRDTTNDFLFPSQGSKNSASVEYVGGPLGGDLGFTKYNGSSTWFFPLPLDTVFGARGRIGYMEGNEGKAVPIYQRFYLGGINSLRGLKDVGPKDPKTGDPIGGLTMLNFNLELVFPLLKTVGIKGVVFYDTGNAWESGYHLDDMRQTTGAGVRWYSPIGPLRLEWAYVLDRKEGEPDNRWEFTIGMFM